MPPQSSHALNSAPSPSEEVFALAAKGGMRKQLSEARNFAASDLLKSPDGNDEPSDLLDIPLSPEERSEVDSPASAAPAAISPLPPPPGHSSQNKTAQPHIARASAHNHRSSKSISVPFPPINVPPTNVLSGSSSGDPGVAIAAVQAALNRAQSVLTRLQNQQHDLHLPSHQNRPHQGLAPPPVPNQPHPSSSHQQLYQELKENHKSPLQTIPQDIEQEGEEDEQVKESSMLIHHVEETTEEASNALTEAESMTITGSTVIGVDKVDPSVKEEGEAKEDANVVRNEVSMAPTNVINEEIPISSTELVNEKSVVKHSEGDSLNHISDVSPAVSVSPLQLEPQSMLQHEDIPKLDVHHHASTMIFNTQEVRMVAAEVAGTLAAKALEAMQAQIEKQQEQLVALQLQQERMLQERERAVAERIVATERQNDAVTLLSVATSTTATQGPSLHVDHDVKTEKNSVHDAVIEKKEEEMSVKELVSEEEFNENEDEVSLAPALTSAMTLTAAAEAAVSAVNLSSSLSRSRRSSSFGGSSDLSASANSSIDVVSALQNARAALARALSAVSDANDDDDGDDDSYPLPARSSAEKILPVSVTVMPHPPASLSTVTASLPEATFVLESHSTPSIQEALPVQQTKPSQAAGVVGTNVVRALQGQRTPLFDSHLLGKQTLASVSNPQSVSTTLPQQIYISASSASSSASKAAAEAVAAAAAVALSRENAQRETAHLQQRTRADPINVSPLVYNSLVSHQPKHTQQNVLVTPPPIRSSRDSENRNYSATATDKFETPIESETVTVFVPGQGIVVMSKAKLAAMHVPVDTSKRAHIDDRGNLNVTVNHGDDSVTENVLNDEVPIVKFPELRSAVPPPTQNLVSRRFGANL